MKDAISKIDNDTPALMSEPKTPLEKYCEEQGFHLAKKIDDAYAVVVKPKPWWMPKKIYESVIRNHCEIVQVQGANLTHKE